MLSPVVNWGDVSRWLVMFGPLLVGAMVIRLVQRRRMSRPWGRAPRSAPYPLRNLAAVLETVLIVDAAVWLGAIALPVLVGVSNFGFLVALVMFVVWFYRARVNAEGRGWPQRRSPGWTIVAWIIPVVNFWFPLEIMADIWRAGLPEPERANRAVLPGIWWACLLSFFCLSSVPTGSAHRVWYVDMAIYCTGVLAAIMTALLVQKVSSSPLGESAWKAVD
jgi:hypothetical protein